MLIVLTVGLDQKEKEEITQIYYQYRSIMKVFALRYVRNESDAEDILHNAFFKIRKKLSLICSLSCKKKQSYIVNIVKTTSIEYLRKEKRYKRNVDLYYKYSDNQDADDDTIENHLEQEEFRLNIERIFYQIDDKYSSPLLLKYYYGYSTKEICKALKIESENTVSSLLHRGKKMFLEIYTKDGGWSA